MSSMWPVRRRNTLSFFSMWSCLWRWKYKSLFLNSALWRWWRQIGDLFYVFVDNKKRTTSGTIQKQSRLNSSIFMACGKQGSELDVSCVWVVCCSLGSMCVCLWSTPELLGVGWKILHKKCNIYKFDMAWHLQIYMWVDKCHIVRLWNSITSSQKQKLHKAIALCWLYHHQRSSTQHPLLTLS